VQIIVIKGIFYIRNMEAVNLPKKISQEYQSST